MYLAIILIAVFLFHLILSAFLISNVNILDSLKYIGNLFIRNYGFININSVISVEKLYFSYFKFSMILINISFLISFFISFLIAYALAKNTNNIAANTFNILVFIFSSIPIFILGPIAIGFASKVNLPIMYIESYYGSIFNTMVSLLLPILILVITILPLGISINYQILNKIIIGDYYKMAKANGANNMQLFVKVILKNWVIEYFEKVIYIYIYLLSYSMIIERFFYIPGQSFLFQYLGNPEYFALLMYSILLNIVIISLIKALAELIIFICEPQKQYYNIINWKVICKKLKMLRKA